MKPLLWLGDSLERIRAFPPIVKQRVGYQLERVQAGGEPLDWKPMPSVGNGAYELRVHAGGEFRVIYMVKFANAVYVLHAFLKKTRKTARLDLEIAARRYRMLMSEKRQ